MIQAVFFDFNGVIIDDEPLQMKAYQEVLGREELTRHRGRLLRLARHGRRAFLRAAFARAERELDDEVLGRLIEAKTAAHRKLLEGELPLFPGVVTFIKALKRQHSLGLVSMARRTEIDHVLERAALDSLTSKPSSAPRTRPPTSPTRPATTTGSNSSTAARRGARHPAAPRRVPRHRGLAARHPSRRAPPACARSASPTPSPTRRCARPAPTPSRAASPTGRPTPSITSSTRNGGNRTEC